MSKIITTFEEHGEVLSYFSQNKYSQETILYFDQHFDFKYIPSDAIERTKNLVLKSKDIGILNRDIPFRDDNSSSYGLDNFLFMAERLGYIKKVIWVIPEVKSLTISDIATKVLNLLSLIPYCGEEILKTFKLHENSIQLTIHSLLLEITTLRRLENIDLTQISRIDIDLDYFFNSHGHCLTSVDYFLNTLSKLNLLSLINTITYSISSGFLPESYRWLANRIASFIAAQLEDGSRPTHNAIKSIAALATEKSLTHKELEHFSKSELNKLGGAGLSLKSMLALNIPDVPLSINSYEAALSQYDGGSLPAYKIGLYFYQQQNFQEAEKWFQKAQGNLTDSMHFHSLTMQSLSLSRLNRFEESLKLSLQAIDLTPLRKQNYILGVISNEKLGKLTQANYLKEKLNKICIYYNEFKGK